MSSRSLFQLSLGSFALLLTSALFGQTPFLVEKFNDGSRTNLAPTSSAAWFSSAAANTVFTNGVAGANGTLALDNGSSRTLVGYFTANGSPVTMGSTDTLTLDILFSIDAVALVRSNGLIIALLQSVANPAAVSGTGFTAPGARVSGDFASSNPASHVFGSYIGYGAWTNLAGGSNPVTIRKRIVPAVQEDGLDNASASWSQIGSASGTATAPAINVDCHAILTLTRTAAGGMTFNYKLMQGATTLANYSSSEAVVTSFTFDTVNVYMQSAFLTGAAAGHFILKQVNVTLSGGALPPAPTITTHPTSQSVDVGTSVDLTVAASGTGPFTYEWKKNGGAPIAGATGPTYTINPVQVTDAGDYVAIVSNAGGSTPSNPATLTVNAGAVAPSITTPPNPQTATAGTTANFSVLAAGSAPLSYQWLYEGLPIIGANSNALALPNVQPSQAGKYSVTVSNSIDSVTSAEVLLTVLVPPSIATPPSGGTVNIGDPFTFTVALAAGGTPPFTYVWRKNGNPIPGATASSYAIAGAQASDEGSYTVVVTNSAGFATSAAAVLNVNSPPAITTHPVSQLGVFGGSISFTVGVSGTAPFSYEWSKNPGGVLPGETSATLTITNAQAASLGAYSVKVTNAFGFAISNPATLTLAAGLPDSAYNLTGFATLGAGTTGGGVIPDTDPRYFKVTNALEFATAIVLSNKTAGAVKVIEIMNDLDLGWNEIGVAVRTLPSTPFRAHAAPKLHPTLIASGVSLVDIKAKSGLTIFSANGATIRHVNFNLKDTGNIIIRNLKFDEMWEWDEATKGDYDSNDWDFITLSNGDPATNIWIDHCTFTKAYDGATDFKAGTQYVTFSWCRYLGDDGATNLNSSVRRQLNALEANKAAYPFYNFLRTNGFSYEEIVAIIQGHDKGHLLGSNSLDPENATLSATFHHQWFQNVWDRVVPRLRGGNVHDYNIFVDDVGVLAAKRLRDTRAAALTTALRNTLNNTYSFNPPINGSISTEGGALLIEKSFYSDCVTPLRNNQTDVNNPLYTGKILALDTIYSFHATNGTTTLIRGNSTDAGNPLGPFQAPIIPFSWNGFSVLPYAYTMHDPAGLPSMLAIGAGAGRVIWSKDNWLRTSYIDPVPPGITTQPTSQTVPVGTPASFTVGATGTGPISYTWYKNDAPIFGETAATLSFPSAQFANAGSYRVNVSTPYGSLDSDSVTLTVTQSYDAWTTFHGLPPAQAGFTADGDADGVVNLLEYYLGLNPTVSEPSGAPTGRIEGSEFVFRFNRSKTATGVVGVVKLSSDLLTWTTAVPAPVLESETGDLETYVLKLPMTSPRLFARLEVTLGGTVLASVPAGYMNFAIAGGVPAAPVTTVFGLPLDDTSAPAAGIRAGRIESFTANSLTQSGGGWTTNLAAPTAPWLVRLTSGPAAGRTLDIVANTATTLTLSGADLTTLGLVAGTDTFELVPLDTLFSFFGDNTLQGGISGSVADNVQVRSGVSWLVYYFDTNLGFWRRTIGPATNANNVVLRPGTGVQIIRRAPALTLTFTGRAPATAFRTPINNANSTVIHTGFPTDTTLGGLALQTLLPGWRSSAVAASADQVALHNGSAWVSYFHNGSFWQPVAGAPVNSDALAISAGALLTIQRPGVTAGTTQLVRTIPYSL
ncbi:MAG TPA: immunoglobulin domain-containing protein [Opitutaceae bacterium]|nr:immunoglobulin domain-containing protein [Opitutaceae bacterium]